MEAPINRRLRFVFGSVRVFFLAKNIWYQHWIIDFLPACFHALGNVAFAFAILITKLNARES